MCRRRLRPPKTTRCPDCGQKVIVALNPRTGAQTVLNPYPISNGGIVLDAERYGPGITPLCKVLTGEERVLHTLHGNPVKRYRLHVCTSDVEDARYEELLRAVNAFVRETQRGTI